MAYRCKKYDKILVGQKRRCATCTTGVPINPSKPLFYIEGDEWNRTYQHNCTSAVWQDGVLKRPGLRKKSKASPTVKEVYIGTPSIGFYYTLGEDGEYHASRRQWGNMKVDIAQQDSSLMTEMKLKETMTPKEVTKTAWPHQFTSS